MITKQVKKYYSLLPTPEQKGIHHNKECHTFALGVFLSVLSKMQIELSYKNLIYLAYLSLWMLQNRLCFQLPSQLLIHTSLLAV